MSNRSRLLPLLSRLLLALPPAAGATGPPASEADDWLEQDRVAAVPQVGAQELEFLAAPPHGKTPLSENRIAITASSLHGGWVALRQCYQGLDAVPEAEIVYRYRNMRGLRVVSTENIGRAAPEGQSVQLSDVGQNATLCIQAEVQILYPRPDGGLELRNGPFLRKFLDGYFPLHVRLEISYPPGLLRHTAISPEPQAGFAVHSGQGLIQIDSWFVGTLNIRVRFDRADAGQKPASR